MWTARWFALVNASKLLEELPDAILNRALSAERLFPFAQNSDAAVAVVLIVHREGKYCETIVTPLPVKESIVNLAKHAAAYDSDGRQPEALELASDRVLFQEIGRATGVPIDDICGTVFFGRGPAGYAARHKIPLAQAFAARYRPAR